MSFSTTDLADRVRRAREARGLTQKQLADLAGIGKTAIFDLEHGNPGVRLSTLLAVFAVLGLELSMLDPGVISGPTAPLPSPSDGAWKELPDRLL